MGTSLSPIKPSKRCFDKYISGGQTKIQFIGFSTTKEKSLEEMAKEKQLSNCLVKKTHLPDDFELIGVTVPQSRNPTKNSVFIFQRNN